MFGCEKSKKQRSKLAFELLVMTVRLTMLSLGLVPTGKETLPELVLFETSRTGDVIFNTKRN